MAVIRTSISIDRIAEEGAGPIRSPMRKPWVDAEDAFLARQAQAAINTLENPGKPSVIVHQVIDSPGNPLRANLNDQMSAVNAWLRNRPFPVANNRSTVAPKTTKMRGRIPPRMTVRSPVLKSWADAQAANKERFGFFLSTLRGFEIPQSLIPLLFPF